MLSWAMTPSASMVTQYNTVISNLGESIVSYGGLFILGGLAIWGINYVFNKFPTWVKRFAR